MAFRTHGLFGAFLVGAMGASPPEVATALRGLVGFGLSKDGQGLGAEICYIRLPVAALDRAQTMLRSVQ
jgi:hypothetical protein